MKTAESESKLERKGEQKRKSLPDCMYKCPTWGHRCKKCGRQNHFASACRSRLAKVHQVDNSDLEDSGSESSVFTVESGRTKYLVEPLVRFRRSGSWMPQVFQLDNGAGVNCLRYEDCCRIMSSDKPVLKKSSKTLTSYSGNRIENMG